MESVLTSALLEALDLACRQRRFNFLPRPTYNGCLDY